MKAQAQKFFGSFFQKITLVLSCARFTLRKGLSLIVGHSGEASAWPHATKGEPAVSGDLAITPAATVPPALSSRAAAGDTGASTAAEATAPVSSLSGPPPVNPGLHLDPALNIVVLQFFDAKGNVTQTIPSQKQLLAYQQGAGAQQPGSALHVAAKKTSPT